MTLPADPADHLGRVLAAVREAGQAVMEFFREDPEVHHKSPDQPVTEADLTADAILRERLLEPWPDYGWLSEETVDRPHRLDRRRVWIVDPIDGTRSFIAGYAEFGISVALVEAGRPILGVVSNPAVKELYWAVVGGGAFRLTDWGGGDPSLLPGESERLVIREPEAAEPAALAASRSELRRGEFDPFGEEWTLEPLGSTAYKLAGVAAGRVHGFISRGPKSEWDLAGGDLIVEEAGGRVTDLRGHRVRYNRADPYVHGVAAGAPGVHARLLALAAPLEAPRLRGGKVRGETGEGDQ